MGTTGIEWTDATWNPIAGCSPVSPGCTHCYAATMARRLEAMGQEKYAGTAERRGSVDVFTGKIAFDEKALLAPLKWKKPRRVFVNSMSDLFHEGVPDEFVDRVWAVMALTGHFYQVLTKRAERMHNYVRQNRSRQVKDAARTMGYSLEFHDLSLLPKILPNVWLGTSVEDQQRADERIPWLLKTPAAVRFLSCEPLLGQVDLKPFLRQLQWIIVGGESGRLSRPCDVSWVRLIVKQCRSADVACFVKQLGASPYSMKGGYGQFFGARDLIEKPGEEGRWYASGMKDRKGGDRDEWPEEFRVRQFPEMSKP